MCAKHTVCVVILPIVIQLICMYVIMTVHVMRAFMYYASM